jgi:predicted TIM-barrel fold metal-dependent hydrolase
MWTAATEMERLKALKLTETEMEKILGANAAALLDIS